MAENEASVAPKEMVNIKLPSPEPGAEGEELPLKMAVVGDFTGKTDDTPVAERAMNNINQKNFNDIMAKMDIRMSFNVANKLSGREGEEIPVELKADSMQSFRPEEIAKQVPQLRDLVELRKRLVSLRSEAVRDPKKLKEFNEVLSKLGLDKS
jgi:type VI secretion system protein ImpB